MLEVILSVTVSSLFGIVLAVVVPQAIGVTPTFGEQIIIGGLTLIIYPIYKIQHVTEQMIKKKIEEEKKLQEKNRFDLQLLNMSDYYRQLLDSNTNEVLKGYFMNEIVQMKECLLDASEKKKFTGRVQHVVTKEYIMNCFGNAAKRVWRFTWEIEDAGNPLMIEDDAWETYFNKAVSLIGINGIHEIDILFITEKENVIEELNDLKKDCGLREYIQSLNKSKRIKAGIVSKARYKACHINSFPQQSVNYDLGIYSKNLLFIYDMNDSRYGEYCSNSEDIEKYFTFFETVWDLSNEIVGR